MALVEKPQLTPEDFEFVSNVRSAVLIKSPKSTQKILWLVTVLLVWLIIWANVAQVDEITRGDGKVIPSGQLQKVQNLEGGIIKKIMVAEGDIVSQGQPLLHIDNTKFTSSFEESMVQLNELEAKSLRLKAEAEQIDLIIPPDDKSPLAQQQKSLFESHKQQLNAQLTVLKEQLIQKENELADAKQKYMFLLESYKLIEKEIAISVPLVEKRVISEVEFLKLQRDARKELEELNNIKTSIPTIESKIKETQNKINEVSYEFQSKAKKELNEVLSEILRLKKSQTFLEDQVSRTIVTSPVDGTVNQIFVNTVGGVVRPGMDLLEIVPSKDILLIEVKIKPSDIAFLFPGQKAMVKFSAYDFAIYGGLEGEVSHISADTITSEEGVSYYLVRIRTKKAYLESRNTVLEVIPGMTASVDILTGKKTVMDYLLKPIFKAKNNALSER